ncbi:histidine kinase [Pedobacter sp. MC2016-15]|uniref:tetratricopeptide repeat-containing sensor histidine kinase n=1 Tax=Pedobacter sp. MC2016-15 TaxID=2994473 RepID=UPI002245E14E|nr:histidine kinase [Pedobacter sp. MC2016-15]MCX2480033.1 histidine kinase [Pedobacter sp. MC2016-15]
MRALFIAVILIWSLAGHAQSANHQQADTAKFNLVNSYIAKKQFDQAAMELSSILDHQAKYEKTSIAKAYSLKGNIFLMQRNPDKALENYFLSLDHYDIKKDSTELAKLHTNIGTLYSMLKQLPKAKEYYLKALSLNPRPDADRLKTMTNLAGVYAELREKEPAFKTFTEGISLAQKLSNLPLEAVLRTNLSNYYIEERDWKNAVINAKSSIAIRNNLKQPSSVITLNNLGYAMVQLKQYDDGINCYAEAMKTANPQEQQQLHYNLYQAYKSLGNTPKSLNSLEQYSKVKDSLSKLNYEQKVAEISASYESLKKQNRIDHLEQENVIQKKQLREQLFLIIAVILIALLVSVLIYMRFKNLSIKEALEKSQIKRQLLLLQLNPHFIFNALQSVQRFIYLKDQEQSMQYLSSFSKLIRLTLENSDRDLIPLDEEIEILDNYLRLQSLNHSPAFQYNINVDPALPTEDMEIPVMLLQPFVENAVIHGMKEQQEGKIKIDIRQNAQALHILIADNGKGRDFGAPGSNNSLHRSMGMDILNQRITEFNRENKHYIQLTISNALDANYPGTAVQISIATSK